MKTDEFEKVWGFTKEEVIEGTVGYSYDDWFSDLDKATNAALGRQAFKSDSPLEKSRYRCLVYMACFSYAVTARPREVTEKTFPNLELALLELQAEFRGYGEMLAALHKKEFRKGLKEGLNNVEAVAQRDRLFREAFNESHLPAASGVAGIELNWDGEK